MKTPTRIAMIAALAAAFLAIGGKDRGPINGAVPDTARAAEVRPTSANPVANVQLVGNFPGSGLGVNR
jgi:hypothetical protein